MNTTIKSIKGYSLIEVLVCCLLLGITGQWVVSPVKQQLDNFKMKRAVAQVHTTFIAGRDAAYGMKKDLWLHIQSTPSNSYIALHADADARTASSIFNKAINPQILADVSLSSTATALRFSGLTGRPSGNGNISVWLDAESKIKVIYHDITGRIRICAAGERTYGYSTC
ncbi:Tfp pilus assembly protein FimT/FimU [Vibrio breoganii]